MLAGKEIVGTIAVKDLAVARKFYEGTLGLKVQDDSGTEAHVYRSGDTRLIVYRSQYAGTNQATGLNLMVGADIDGIVRGLRDRGVKFEHYDIFTSPCLAETVRPFLDGQSGAKSWAEQVKAQTAAK